jgi:hypothetical protein
MDKQSNSTPAFTPLGELTENIVSQLELIRAYRGLEHQICCLSHMADILGDLLDHAMVDRREERKASEAYQITLGANEVDQLAFAWNDVSYRATFLKDAFYAVGKDA